MGYTHYWGWGAFINEEDYKNALKDCRKIIRECGIPLASPDGKGKPIMRNGFGFNGVGDDGCEDLWMKAEPDRDPEAWRFCKTNRHEYDIVVVACLCAMQDRLGRKAFEVTSDGDPHEWEEGRALARKILNRSLIRIPQGVVDQLGMYGWAARLYRKEHPEYRYTSIDKTHPNWREENIPEYAKAKLCG
jgi:hypothetical protein